jgi:Transposase IS4
VINDSVNTGLSSSQLAAAFHEGWREMRKEGWFAVRGRGLQEGYIYVRANSSVGSGVSGVDYFVGDIAFANWWISQQNADDQDADDQAHKNDDDQDADDQNDDDQDAIAEQNDDDQDADDQNDDDQDAIAEQNDDDQDADDQNDDDQDAIVTSDCGFDFCSTCGLRVDGNHGTCTCAATITQLPSLSLSQFSQTQASPPPSQYDYSDLPSNDIPASFVMLLDAAQSAGEEEAKEQDEDEEEIEAVKPYVPVDDVYIIEDDDDRSAYDSDEGPNMFDADEEEQEIFEEAVVDDVHVDDDTDVELVDAGFLASLGGSVRLENGQVDAAALRIMRWEPVTEDFYTDGTRFPRMTTVQGGPIQALMDVYDNPAALFFSFFPRSHWVLIARESNRYERQTRASRADKIQDRQRRRHALDSKVVVEAIEDIKARMRNTPKIEAWEIVRTIGLLIANVLCTQTMGIYLHWSMNSNGALTSGSFGHFLSRNRFKHVLAMLHFTDNHQRNYVNDKAWKIRPVIQVLERSFKELWVLTPELSFDEGVLPSTSRMNPTRMYMPDKPHQWGTKLFMTCDAATCYCFR